MEELSQVRTNLLALFEKVKQDKEVLKDTDKFSYEANRCLEPLCLKHHQLWEDEDGEDVEWCAGCPLFAEKMPYIICDVPAFAYYSGAGNDLFEHCCEKE
jgi:hypothetical protein